ncbi:hypothetical protein PTKIN_Ptkin18bG0069000 [Pterospermum kingtungense]
MDLLYDFGKAQVPAQRQHPTEQERWQAPDVGITKLNFDGAVQWNMRIDGVGVIARDYTGAFLGAIQASIPDKIDPLIVEAYAAIRL